MEPTDPRTYPLMPDLPYQKLERLFHEPARLAILSLLIHKPNGIPVPQLREELDLTFGNLDRHLKVLAEAEIIITEKIPSKRRPQSLLRLTEAGRHQFLTYLDHLEVMLRAAAQAREGAASTQVPPLPGSGSAPSRSPA